MTSSFVPSATSDPLSPADLRQHLRTELTACRQSTLTLVQDIQPAEWRQQAHPDFSPVGWHLGHIAFTESYWLLEQLQQRSCPYPQYRQLFAADGLPKAERENLPDLDEILAFLQDIRDRVLTYLDRAPLTQQQRLWRWILQHESQHAETATYVLTLHRWSSPQARNTAPPAGSLPLAPPDNRVLIPSGELYLGADSPAALDNERPVHRVHVNAYWLDRQPVTVADYAQFMAAGGYTNRQWWHPQGWQWVRSQGITQPLYWRDDLAWQRTPVCGVSWYEADAYACFVGKRLPTEAEWERAARYTPTGQNSEFPWGNAALTPQCGNFGGEHGGVTPVGHFPAGRSCSGCDDLLGNVWEWTSSWFDGYPGFTPYPYEGYSQAYFDCQHRVLRGGSWATRPWVLRPTFRNWYHPWVRPIFAGFRCALSA